MLVTWVVYGRGRSSGLGEGLALLLGQVVGVQELEDHAGAGG